MNQYKTRSQSSFNIETIKLYSFSHHSTLRQQNNIILVIIRLLTNIQPDFGHHSVFKSTKQHCFSNYLGMNQHKRKFHRHSSLSQKNIKLLIIIKL